jgi:hypothetical protein
MTPSKAVGKRPGCFHNLVGFYCVLLSTSALLGCFRSLERDHADTIPLILAQSWWRQFIQRHDAYVP